MAGSISEGKTHLPGSLVEAVEGTLRKYSMLRGGETVLVGLSGGPDSVCLLRVLAKLRETFGFVLHAVYVNHNLRPGEIPSEISFCDALCREVGAGFLVKSVDVKSYAREYSMSKQEAARDLRYGAFEEAAMEVGAGRIALGHNADDQIETFMMRLLRGSGRKGLSAMSAVRGRIIRPLIETERRSIEEYLETEGVSFVLDSSNLRDDYLRNRIRKALLPLLRELNPNLTGTLLRTLSILRDEERYLELIVTSTLMKLISRKTPDRIELFLSPLEATDPVILRRVLRRAIGETKGLRRITFEHIEDIIELIRKGKPGDRLNLPRGIRVIKEYSVLTMTSELPAKIAGYSFDRADKLFIGEAGLVLHAEDARRDDGDDGGRFSVILDADKLQFPLTVRRRTAGDLFYPRGFGRKKKLQDFFVDEKVPRDERDSVPLVLSGNEIVWVAGYRADERFGVTEGTEKFIKLIISKGRT